MEKTLSNISGSDVKEKVSDVEFFGNPDTWQLLSKAWSKKESWMKSCKAMQCVGGCVVQVSTQQLDNVAEAVTFVPGVKIVEDTDDNGIVVGRHLE